ncbi:MAG: hypothetical protein ACE5NJ_12185, partial [Thermodesulfobacteriota bacterium]
MDFCKSDEEGPATIFFATMPFEYLADTSQRWARNGVRGFMLSGIMRNWDSDVWLTGKKRITGERNTLLKRVRKMNLACADKGIDCNFIKVAFYSHLPDWFDDEGWTRLCENFRQGSAFARDGLFHGMAIDIEYISEIYDISWKGYRDTDYPVSELREKAKLRGAQMVQAMLDEYPSMEILHLPQGPECYGPLAADLFSGMLSEMARRNSPGGLHLLTEATYLRTNVDWLIRYGQELDEIVEEIASPSDWPYWRDRCSISFGLWPLGYYREILDEKENFLGYGGKKERFGDEVVGSYADKSDNYSAGEFKAQFAAARMLCKRYVWIYCHGSTFWKLTPEEMERYGGHESDALPVVENLNEYIDVLRDRDVINDARIFELTRAVLQGWRVDFLGPMGSPREWTVIGPFDNYKGGGFAAQFPPEKELDLNAVYPGVDGEARWRRLRVSSTGFVDLARHYRPPDFRCAYALSYANVPRVRRVQLLVGSDDGIKIWLGSDLVYQLDAVRGAEPDDDTISVDLPAGKVPVLLKIVNHRGAW